MPSTGSVTHEGLSVKIIFLDSLELTVSSPINVKVGYNSFNEENIIFSTFLSTSVTKSVALESFISNYAFIISLVSKASFIFSPAFIAISFTFSNISS